MNEKKDSKLYRIVDANLNRSIEGLRVCEDITRYFFDDVNLSKELKVLRHSVLQLTLEIFPRGELIKYRDVVNDVGKDFDIIKVSDGIVVTDLFYKNIQRVKESLRVLEEMVKITDHVDRYEEVKGFRYKIYELESRFTF